MNNIYRWIIVNENDKNIYYETIKKTPNIELFHNNYLIYTTKNGEKYFNKIIFYILTFNKYTFDFIRSLASEAIKLAREVGEEPFICGEKELDHLSGTIYSLIQKWSYQIELQDNKGMLYFCSDLLYSVITRHKLKNGNKRTGLYLIILILKKSGLMLKFNPMEYESNEWKPFLNQIIVNKNNGISEDDQIEKIKLRLENRILILYNYLY